MALWIFRLMAVFVGPMIGWYKISPDARGILIGISAALFIILMEIVIERVPLTHLLFGIIGAGLGLIFAWFINEAVLLVNEPRLSSVTERYSGLIYLVMTYLGMVIAVRRQQELDKIDRGEIVAGRGARRRGQEIKILDTSAIIDGRVVDVLETRFLVGPIVLPRFILKELQDIADSPDTNKRARGRRGLDILKRLQENSEILLKVYDKDYSSVPEVDGKLVQLAKELDAKVLTTDFNLNKVAALQGVTALNINDLANALKPVVLPGESMMVYIVKEGKERDQGVGYLDDGTMVVVEDGRRHIGKRLDTVVTSVLQTSAGRMIFARVKEKE